MTTLQMSPKAADKMSSMAGMIRRMKEKQQEATARSVTTLEVAMTAGALGFMEGRYDRTEIMGAPMAALVGVGAHVAAYVTGGKEADHLHAVGDGALAVAAFTFAKEVGVERKNKANGVTTAGYFGGGYYPGQAANTGWQRAA